MTPDQRADVEADREREAAEAVAEEQVASQAAYDDARRAEAIAHVQELVGLRHLYVALLGMEPIHPDVAMKHRQRLRAIDDELFDMAHQ